MTITPRGWGVLGTAGALSIVAATCVAGMLSTAATDLTTEERRSGKDSPSSVVTSPPAPVARAVPVKASRSRATPSPATGTPRRLSCTCYVATGNRTASGEWPSVGGAASNLFPLGTMLRVEDIGLVRINDRVGHSSDLDLFYSSRSACLQFGRRSLAVEVVR